MHSSKSNNQQMILYCNFSSDTVISPLFRGLERAMSRQVTITLPGQVLLLVLTVLLLPAWILSIITGLDLVPVKFAILIFLLIFSLIPAAILSIITGLDLVPVKFIILIFLVGAPIIAVLFLLNFLFGIPLPPTGRRSYKDIFWLRNMYNSLDIVETGFRYMDIEDESCRLKTICELESYAVSHPLASLAINTINSNLRGLDRYQTAIQAGINGEDCALIYDQCRVSYVGY